MAWFFRFLEALYEALRGEYHTAPEAPKLPDTPSLLPKPTNMTPQQLLYNVAKDSLGTHMTLDDSVPMQVGCAEAVSAVLKDAGVPGIPPKGIAGTASLLAFLEKSPNFSEIEQGEPGSVIISATGTGNGKIRGHVGICGINGIMSNESQTGLWREQWDETSWDSYYRRYGGIPTRRFRYNGAVV